MICLIPVLLLSILWITRLFPDDLSHNKAAVTRLSNAEKTNISLACHKINNLVLKPKESFSFNKVVGPRVMSRGFLKAPSYENGTTVMTTGGGICLVSSLLYKSALEAGLKVVKRKAHSRPIKSVAPGFDATVLYGRYDLEFRNESNHPVQLKASTNSNQLDIRVLGVKPTKRTELVTAPYAESLTSLDVKVYRKSGSRLKLISNDHYKKSKM